MNKSELPYIVTFSNGFGKMLIHDEWIIPKGEISINLAIGFSTESSTIILQTSLKAADDDREKSIELNYKTKFELQTEWSIKSELTSQRSIDLMTELIFQHSTRIHQFLYNLYSQDKVNHPWVPYNTTLGMARQSATDELNQMAAAQNLL